jgi:hypothetical protein
MSKLAAAALLMTVCDTHHRETGVADYDDEDTGGGQVMRGDGDPNRMGHKNRGGIAYSSCDDESCQNRLSHIKRDLN